MTDSSGIAPPHVSGTPNFRRASAALFAAGLGTFMTLYCVQALLPSLASDFDLSPAGASLSVSVATLAMAVGVIPLTALSDAWSRTTMMSLALGAAAVFGVASAFAPNFPVLLVLRLLQGLSLAGLQATAMSYLSEEVHSRSLGQAMGLYVAGNGIGGMIGRLIADGVLQVSDSWRWSIGAVGVIAAVCALVFHLSIPPSVRFVRRDPSPRALAKGIARALPDSGLLRLYLIGFVAMAAFVTIYNYLGFRLIADPFDLSEGTAGLLFIAYVSGSFSSALAGRLVDRYSRQLVLVPALVVALAGLALMLIPQLGAVIPGLVVFTVGFFAAHAVASGWVGARSSALGVQGAAVYLFFYYIGSAVGGSAGGTVFSHSQWNGLTVYTGCLVVVGLVSALTLRRLRPPHHRTVAAGGPAAEREAPADASESAEA
ncbi:MFS transporter [Streptomyces tsukubensis]|uniref:MFS transporter n=1 Tax=Streptomyces tsukubensis TaxID=83656 RepID=UPI001D03ECB2|nr:MFS transporter [Streptomyces tsukubensis]